MFTAFFNIFTNKENVRIEGRVWLVIKKDGAADIKVMLTSPYSDIAATASIKNGKVEFPGMVIDPVKEDFTDYILMYLYSANKYFEDNLPHIKKRYVHYLNSEEYEHYCAYHDIKKEIENKIHEHYDLINKNGITPLSLEISQLEEKLEYYTGKIDNHRLTMIKEITAINEIIIDDDLIIQIFDKYFKI